MPKYRSATTTHGRNMAGAPPPWRAPGTGSYSHLTPPPPLPVSTPASPLPPTPNYSTLTRSAFFLRLTASHASLYLYYH
ncbi:hypothetical protein FG680_22285, partial [Salmonella enterica subsp. enterica serovar Javiana]